MENKNYMGVEKLVNVGNPTQPTDGVNKQYIDNKLTDVGNKRLGNLSQKISPMSQTKAM